MTTATTAAEVAAAELWELHASGAVAGSYPRVRGLLAELSGDDLRRAGALLSRVPVAEVLAAHPDTAVVRVAITGHGTLGPLVPALTVELARHGVLLEHRLGDFDGWVFDLGDPASELRVFGPDLLLCVLDPAIAADELPLPWTPDDLERVLAAKQALITGLVREHVAGGAGTLVLNTVPLPADLVGQLVDYRSRARVGALWREHDAYLLGLAAEHPGVVVLDLDPVLADGVPAVDPRLDVYAGAHLSVELLTAYAREVGHVARAVTGRAKKVLAVDLDETLWGGILGDDGAEGIEPSGTGRGAAFARYQRLVKQIGSQGVLLAAVSKNDREPVAEVLREHPGMTLREVDFVRVVANWNPKHDNIRELAADLNLGVDSVVFTDDNPFECGLVRSRLPGVAVVRLDSEPATHGRKLLRDNWFAALELTAEDGVRATRYRDDLARKDFLDTFESVADYLGELGVRVRLGRAGETEWDRVAQLTQRTNQFTMTAARLSSAEVRALAQDPDGLVLALHSADRFGDNGLVGALLAHRDRDALHLDNFLLSCRVFGRGVETAGLAALLRHAADSGVRGVRGAYRPTSKNGKVRDFYTRHGFALAGRDGDTELFHHDLVDLPGVPGHVRLRTDLEELR
ncbi:HAD-IIIC family phosphatase [Actinokineospora auranticolor]|uniref:HAD superfamily phosphatase (TIGR01681 family)/FkbH-like protein n=1 Tax=Actinokineospora auranticolor TaxID=155976 RepID=A0A2S6GLY4_9PSEU|nr:HAD-IIIC family phosphatase [Actinokineospora auranticolor]PPK66161.1 HAD superfamily phosphatase (TIGR01681 family)/FkbH-like protein [Actinokineospora auranticolor]